jgi:hypothetical protein
MTATAFPVAGYPKGAPGLARAGGLRALADFATCTTGLPCARC